MAGYLEDRHFIVYWQHVLSYKYKIWFLSIFQCLIHRFLLWNVHLSLLASQVSNQTFKGNLHCKRRERIQMIMTLKKCARCSEWFPKGRRFFHYDSSKEICSCECILIKRNNLATNDSWIFPSFIDTIVLLWQVYAFSLRNRQKSDGNSNLGLTIVPQSMRNSYKKHSRA